MPKTIKQPSQTLAILVVAAAYFIAGKFGLSLAFVNASASAIWPPSGLALAALLLWGDRVWPGIFIGAFLVNITTQGSVATTLAIATGNTLEALIGAWLVNRFAGGAKFFQRPGHIFIALFAACLSNVVSATVGVASLTIGGYASLNEDAKIWLTWCLGDIVGDVIVTPLLVIWLTQPYPRLNSKRILEAAGLLLSLVLVGQLVFMGEISSGMEYLATLPLLWAAFRFEQRGAVTAAFIISGIALAGTLREVGPFATDDPNQSLLLLQSFVGTMTIASLVFAAVIAERKRTERRLEVQDAVSRILAESPAVDEAASRILQVLCQMSGWDVGAVWEVDRAANELICVQIWHGPHISVPEFAAYTRQSRFAPGVAQPGRVWSRGEPLWIPDVGDDENFSRGPLAIESGLHAAFAFPIKLGQAVLGVVECFSVELRQPDEEFLQMVSHIGEQFGQFVERKRAEETLRAKEAQLRLITDTAPVLLAQCGTDERYKFVNRAYAERFSLAAEQIIGKRRVEILGEQAYRLIYPNMEQVQKGEAVDYELEVPYERIGRRFVRVAHVPEKDRQGRVIGWVSAITDITQRKLVEQARQQSEALKGAILDSALDCIISIDARGDIIEFNPAAERTFGYTRSQVLGKSLADLIIPLRLRERHSRGLASYLATREGAIIGRRIEMAAMRADGTEFPCELSINTIQLDAERIFTAYLRDISQRKQAEAALQQTKDELARANADLERRVQERTIELERANAALLREMEEGKNLEAQLRHAQKMESIGTLAGGIAHDFNNILNIIKGYAAILRQRPAEDGELMESLHVIDETTDRGAAIVQQLLALARGTESNFEPMRLNDSLERLQTLLGEIFPKTIDIILRLDPELPPVKADRSQIEQVLINICLNARDAMPQGGHLVLASTTVAAEGLRDRFPNAEEERYVCVSVSDTGHGMAESVKNRIFEPFFTTKDQSQGTGLGLSVAYGIVTNHRGFIDVVSRINQGTTFLMYFPVLGTDVARHAGTQPLSADRFRTSYGQGHTVLFVEDEAQQLNLMRRLLESEGYRVLLAADGVEAVDTFAARKDEISVVVLDLGLPKLNGWQAFQRMKQLEPGLQPILATGHVSPEIEAALAQGELNAVIMKPYRLDEVLEKIAAAVGKSHEEAAPKSARAVS